MRSLESPIIDLISTFLAKHDKSEKVAQFKCGHKKGDPNHIESQLCGEAEKVDSNSIGALPGVGRMDTSGSAALSVQATATSDLGSLSGYERALAVDD